MPAERTAVFGVSAGGELALALGLRHPDVYSAIFCASPGGGYRPTGVMPSSLPPRVPRRGHPGAVLPRQRQPVGDRASGRRRRSCDDRARRIARRYVLARRAAADGGVGTSTMMIPARVGRTGRRSGFVRRVGEMRTVRQRLVSPPVALAIDVFRADLAEIGGADDEGFEAVRPGFVASPHPGRDAHRVPCREFDDLVVDLQMSILARRGPGRAASRRRHRCAQASPSLPCRQLRRA